MHRVQPPTATVAVTDIWCVLVCRIKLTIRSLFILMLRLVRPVCDKNKLYGRVLIMNKTTQLAFQPVFFACTAVCSWYTLQSSYSKLLTVTLCTNVGSPYFPMCCWAGLSLIYIIHERRLCAKIIEMSRILFTAKTCDKQLLGVLVGNRCSHRDHKLWQV